MASAVRHLLQETLEVINITAVDEPDETEEEAWVSLGLFTQILLLVATLLISHVLESKRVFWLGEAGVALLLGMLVGVIISFTSKDDSFLAVMSFQNDFFFLVLLPPIIFEAGFSLNVQPFLDNIGAVCTLAFGGTFISTMSIAVVMWVAGLAKMCYALSFLEAMLFGAIISATDPVTVLSVFQRLGANVDMYSIVFGESVLNDAVAIVLYRTVSGFLNPDVPSSIGMGILSFLIIFLGSMFCGIFTAIVSSVLFKTGYFANAHGPLEAMIVILFAFLSYMIAEAFELSGIVSVLFCGMVMAKYTRANLSPNGDSHTMSFFKILASMAETFVFIYIGTSLCLEKQAWGMGLTWSFLAVALFALAISRGLNVYPLAAFINCLRPKDVQIPWSHQHMIWFSGLRGAIAFALSLSAAAEFGEPGQVFLTTTFFIILLTVLINGGMAAWLLDRLKLLGGPSEGMFAHRSYQNLEDQGLGTTTRESEMVIIGLERSELGQGSARTISDKAESALTDGDGDSLRGESTGPGTPTRPISRAVSGVVSKMKDTHSKVREMNGQSLSDKLSGIDRKYLSKFLVGENSSRPGGSTREAHVEVRHQPVDQFDLELSDISPECPLDTSAATDSPDNIPLNLSG
eukprot:CAMPEP_0117670146 /NCGR_PEP_ID=MMETSP0804-20121206/12572_1 /TAXON_ID=1074897 /ORGANISM="Tetraselmis astigmatica, Strain CCMP880" /LENGTH=630 /DNA_ID=CAMNT_0005478375 /DNA_START=78 /DNA_END=1967 /DNA_ORIENTATION=+